MKKIFAIVFLSGLLFAGFGDLAMRAAAPLKPSEAFKNSLEVEAQGYRVWLNISKGIHVYKKSLAVYANGKALEVALPEGLDEEGQEVYRGALSIVVSKSQLHGASQLFIAFSGCADDGICYAPMNRSLEIPGVKSSPKISELLKSSSTKDIVSLLSHEGSFYVVMVFFLFGLLLSLTPCIFPMIPILSSLLVAQKESSSGFMLSLVYVLFMALAYTIVGLGAGMLGADVQAAMQNPYVLILFCLLFVWLAFSLFGYYEIGLPQSWMNRLNSASNKAQGRGGYFGAAAMGLLSALIVGPCVAPPLAGAVLFISQTGDAILGAIALFVMGIGMGVPLLVIGAGSSRWMPKPGGWMNRVSEFFGVVMLALALMMLSRVVSEAWLMIAAGIVLVFVGGALLRRGMLFKIVGGVAVVLGLLEFYGSTVHATLWHPLTTSKQSPKHYYSLAKLLNEVKLSGTTSVVVFGRESCTACKELEHITLQDPNVQRLLGSMRLVEVDVTRNNEEDREIMKHFGLFGTPQVLFFDKEGNWLKQKGITGYVSPELFAQHLQNLMK